VYYLAPMGASQRTAARPSLQAEQQRKFYTDLHANGPFLSICIAVCVGPLDLGHLQRADSFWCLKRSKSVCLGRTAGTKIAHVRMGREGQPNGSTHIFFCPNERAMLALIIYFTY
jgi:hypothetical protein